MGRSIKPGFVVLAILFMSFKVHALPTADVDDDSKLPPLIFPKENVTIGTGLPPVIFPTENVTIGDSPVSVQNVAETTTKKVDVSEAEAPPLIFPQTDGSVPLIKLPPLVFPDDNATRINDTALDILNAAKPSVQEDMHILPSLDDDYYKVDSSEDSYSSDSDEVEDVQAVDKNPQSDNLEENYKPEMNRPPFFDSFDYEDVDHPMLENSHILGIIGAVLAALCVFIYLGITIWRRLIFSRYGMRERLINEDDFYINKSIPHNF